MPRSFGGLLTTEAMLVSHRGDRVAELRANCGIGAIASFLMKGNPNELKLTPEDVASVPIVQDGSEWVINGNGFDTADAKRLASRCAFWRKTSARVPV